MKIPNDMSRRTLLRGAALGSIALAVGVDKAFGQLVIGTSEHRLHNG